MSPELDLRGLHRAHDPEPEFIEQLRLRLEAAATGAMGASGRVDEAETALVLPAEAIRTRRRRIAAPVAAAIVGLAAVGGVLWAESDDSDPTIHVGNPETSIAPAPVKNGWIARADDGDISLVRPGERSRRLEVAGSDTADDGCPAWSPDGTRLLFGRLTGSSDATRRDAELVIVTVGLDGVAGAPTVIALDGFDVPDGFDPHPCGTWAPDGRWVALRGPGEVWVVDTQTGRIRHLPDLRPIDLEWRPGTDELAIAGDMGMTRAAEWSSTPVRVYAVSTGELHQLGSVEAANITWSPDGSTLAYAGTYEPPGATDPAGLWLVDADGANERVLVADAGDAVHGIGPAWSPTGDRIVYQRLCCGRAETHEVVLVNVADGTETVIEPPQDDGDEMVRWYPFTVSWSPDGETLLYTAWRVGAYRPVDGRAHVIAVSADTPSDVTVLALGGAGSFKDHQWVVTQMWGRQPG